MPRNPDTRARSPSIRAKMSSIKGLTATEKQMFVRIGSLIDALVIGQRALSNPDSDAAKRISDKVPIPRNVTVGSLLDGVQLTWDPVDFGSFSSYEVQVDSTATFASPTSFLPTVSRINVRDSSSAEMHLRVRTLSKEQGLTSDWSDTVTLTLEHGIYDVDTDRIIPENRTTVNPQPELIGASINVVSGNQAFIPVGASVGPGPSFVDLGNTIGSGDVAKSQITYRQEENNTKKTARTMCLPDKFNESTGSSSFYPFFPDTHSVDNVEDRDFTSFTGSFVDFLDNFSYTEDPATIDIKFLTYVQDPHEEAGTIVSASHFLIKS